MADAGEPLPESDDNVAFADRLLRITDSWTEMRDFRAPDWYPDGKMSGGDEVTGDFAMRINDESRDTGAPDDRARSGSFRVDCLDALAGPVTVLICGFPLAMIDDT